MGIEQEAAYALASWQRFDSEITDELARAITSAFALVAVADGDLAKSEIDRFSLLIKEQAALLDPQQIDRFDPLFNEIAGAMMSDPETGRSHALELISAVKDSNTHCELVRSAAEIAIAADSRELSSERDVMMQICSTLNIEVR